MPEEEENAVQIAGDSITIDKNKMRDGTARIVTYRGEKLVIAKDGGKVRIFKLVEGGPDSL